MKLIRGLQNLKPLHQTEIATIGNFDGIHLGHQKILSKIVAQAREKKAKCTVICFEPLPQEFFLGDKAPARLTPLRDKFLLLKEMGVDQLLCINFNANAAATSAKDFVEKVLVDGLQIKQLKVGDDFRFGKDRTGDFEFLKKMGAKHDFEVLNTQTLRDNATDQRISSTLIRTALDHADMHRVSELLGREFSMGGIVIHGDKRGRQLGFPTANVSIARRVSPIRGVFAVEVEGLAEQRLPGVANIGTRPTVGGTGFLIEVHLLDFEKDIYGQRINTIFKQKIRDEQKFDGLDELVKQIAKDKKTALNYFGKMRERL